MKPVSSIICLALPFLASAAPIIEKREMCNVFNNDGAVKCRSGPHFDAKVVTTIGDGDGWDFSCYKAGDCYEGNCTWDYNWELKCYINGYYTSDQCNTSNFPFPFECLRF
ncbi:hypothetical protein BGZ63DRAFT_401218 [Mariannaea sp. PMI_226]|nr:hypothetical protein BGZ63DRAFT_401218 [Mariannaea sp. PMI_226]